MKFEIKQYEKTLTNEQSQNNRMGMGDGCIKLLKSSIQKG